VHPLLRGFLDRADLFFQPCPLFGSHGRSCTHGGPDRRYEEIASSRR
jgi:hypothetical protein